MSKAAKSSRPLAGAVAPAACFVSVQGLADALRRAAEAHHLHEQETGSADANWPDWYAAYIAAEQELTKSTS